MKKTIIFFCLFLVSLSANASQKNDFSNNFSETKQLRSKKDLFESGSKRIIEPIDEYLDMSRLTVYGLVKEESCSDSDCPKNLHDYEWIADKWQDCENDSKNRVVKCVRIDTGLEVESSFCLALTKPTNNQSCGVNWDEDETPYYVWLPSSFSQCDNQCGFGYQTRSISCYDKKFNKVEDEFCAQENPYLTYKECYSVEGCEYRWIVGEWSECNNGVMTRSVDCVNKTNQIVDYMQCKNQAWFQPVKDSYECPNLESFHWEYGEWSECVIENATTAYEIRSAVCVDGNNQEVDISLCQGSAKFPTPANVKRSCSDWILSNWSECTTDNVRTRTLYCGSPVVKNPADETLCSDKEKPNVELVEPCAMTLYNWHASSWQTRCNGLPATRKVECRQIFTGKSVDDSMCDSSSKPNEISTPWDNVPAENCYYDWSLTGWNNCEAVDGELQHTPKYACMKIVQGEAFNQSEVEDFYCEDLSNTEAVMINASTYQACTYSWSIDPWSICNHETLKKTRSVKCLESRGEILSDTTCSLIEEKPSSSMECELDYYWDYRCAIDKSYKGCSDEMWPESDSFDPCPTDGSIPFRTRETRCIAVDKGSHVSNGHVVPDYVCNNSQNTIGTYNKEYIQCQYYSNKLYWLEYTECSAGCRKQGTKTWTVNDCSLRYLNQRFNWVFWKKGNDAKLCLVYGKYIESNLILEDYAFQQLYSSDDYLNISSQLPYIDENAINYTNSEKTSLLYTESCIGSCDGEWVTTGTSQCMFNNHFSTGGFMNVDYGCESASSGDVITDEDMMPCDPDTKPANTQIGCYYNVSDPSEMARINGLISQYVQNPYQYYNGEIVPGSDLEELMYNINGYNNP